MHYCDTYHNTVGIFEQQYSNYYKVPLREVPKGVAQE